ncbi:MAG: hypothetical protein U1C96_03020 [Gallionella sp.]|nr:hypothetical protein [Gallionella sp.]
MNTHKLIIGISWIIFGALIVSVLLLNLTGADTRLLVLGSLAGLLYLVAGFSLIANFSWSARVCLPCSALSLLSFPVGTVFGAYYLWYYFKLEKMH